MESYQFAGFGSFLQKVEPMANLQLWKRLDGLGAHRGFATQSVCVFRGADETDEDVERKIARWKADEKQNDIFFAGPYEGRDLDITVWHFVSP